MSTELYLVRKTDEMTEDMMRMHGIPIEKISLNERDERDYDEEELYRVFSEAPKVYIGKSHQEHADHIKHEIKRPIPVSDVLKDTIELIFKQQDIPRDVDKDEILEFIENSEVVFISSIPENLD